MTIGIDASRANVTNRTGTEWYSFFVIQELKKIIPADCHVVLYSKEPLLSDLADLPINWESRVLGWPPKLLWTQLRLSLEMVLHKPDLLYVPAHTIPLIHPPKVVLVVHDLGFAREESLYSRSAAPIAGSITRRMLSMAARIASAGRYSASEVDYHRFSMDVATRAATQVITISEFSRQEIATLYPQLAKRTVVIPNGVNPAIQATPWSELQQRYHLRSPYLLFTGRIELKKNIPRLITAFAALTTHHPTIQLVLAGKPGTGYAQVQALISSHQIGHRVILPGWVSAADLQGILAHAEVFVFPSLYEGFGMPILEAMQAGVPVTCSNIPALSEIAGQSAILFDPTNAVAISQAIDTILTNSATQERLKAAGPTTAAQFTWVKTAAATWALCQKVLAVTK